jgi:hypothetical protein
VAYSGQTGNLWGWHFFAKAGEIQLHRLEYVFAQDEVKPLIDQAQGKEDILIGTTQVYS